MKKKSILISIAMVSILGLSACSLTEKVKGTLIPDEKEEQVAENNDTNIPVEENKIDNNTEEDIESETKSNDKVRDVTSERPEEYAEPDDLDEPLGDYGDQENPIIAVFTNLWELENLPEDVSLGILRADMDAYLRYCFPNIDKQYNVSVVKGSEKDDTVRYEFKVIVEAINPDGSDLSIKCRWYHLSKGETGHYDFFSDITPEGTRSLTDENGNPIDWDAPLSNPFK